MSSEPNEEAFDDSICAWCGESLSDETLRAYREALSFWEAEERAAEDDPEKLEQLPPVPKPTCALCQQEIAENQQDLLAQEEQLAGYRFGCQVALGLAIAIILAVMLTISIYEYLY